jgi:hypothetical protein
MTAAEQLRDISLALRINKKLEKDEMLAALAA